jgi:hypothetical protein
VLVDNMYYPVKSGQNNIKNTEETHLPSFQKIR